MARQLMGIYSLPVWGLIDCVGKGKLLFFIYTYVHIHQAMSKLVYLTIVFKKIRISSVM
jgi:hypothetical protein